MIFMQLDYLLISLIFLSLLILIGLPIVKFNKKPYILYRLFRFKKRKIYLLYRLCLAIFTFCLTILSAKLILETSIPLILTLSVFTLITSIQVFWWNLTYNSKEDLSPVYYWNKKKRNLRQANLSHEDFSGKDLSWINLSHKNLAKYNFSETTLTWANLKRANLCGANLRDADLRGADLRDADLYGANLSGANLRDANLRGADLMYAKGLAANLSGANLRDANLRRANLSMANLCGVNISKANVKQSRFNNTIGITKKQQAYLVKGGAIFDDEEITLWINWQDLLEKLGLT